jgi:hypothetical protein
MVDGGFLSKAMRQAPHGFCAWQSFDRRSGMSAVKSFLPSGGSVSVWSTSLI